MIRLLATAVLSVLGNAAGLLLAALILPDFRINAVGFAVSVLFFTVAQLVLSPFVLKLSLKYLPVLRGGIALVTVFVVLVLTVLFTDGLRISGVTTWVVSPLVIWVATIVAGIFLPMVIFKKTLSRARSNSDAKVSIK